MATKHFQDQLETAVKQGALTEKGRAWLYSALNVFSDTRFEPAGFPDSTRGSTVVRNVNHVVSIPNGTSTVGGAFDLYVFSFPEICQLAWASQISIRHIVDPVIAGWFKPDGSPVRFGLFNAFLLPVGTVFYPPTFGVAYTLPAGSWCYNSNFTEFCTGRARITAAAYKVQAVGPVLDTGGGALHWRLPAGRESTGYSFSSLGTRVVSQTAPAIQVTLPPGNVAEARLIPDSHTGAAGDGAYMNLQFNRMPELAYCGYDLTVGAFADYPNLPNRVLIRGTYSGALGDPPDSINASVAGASSYGCGRYTGTDLCGSYFTNVPEANAFQMHVRLAIEESPAPTHPDTTLAHPSPPEDALAWELYQRIVTRVATSARFGDNDTGAWWNAICAAGVVVSSVIPHPLFRAAVMPTIRFAKALDERRTHTQQGTENEKRRAIRGLVRR